MKAGVGAPDSALLPPLASLFAGMRWGWPVAAFWLVTALGAAVGFRRTPVLASALAGSIAAQVAGVLIAAPSLVEIPAVFARYVVCVLPAILTFAALGLDAVSRAACPARIAPVASAVIVAGLVALGPLPRIHGNTINFANHADYQFTYEPIAPAPQVPAFYCFLRDDPAAYAIVEAPFFTQWHADRFHRYQRVHRRPVYLGFLPTAERDVYAWPFGPLFRFERFVALTSADATAALPVRYALLHKDLRHEMGSAALPPGRAPELRTGPFRRQLAARFGRPVFEDAQIVVFRVDGVRDGVWTGEGMRCAEPRWNAR